MSEPPLRDSSISARRHADQAGLIGAVQLAPSWVLAGRDAILAVDIGGTNVRAGVVELNRDGPSSASVPC